MSFGFPQPSISRPPEYRVDRTWVLKGSTVIARLRRNAKNPALLDVLAVGGAVIGTVESQAQALLMAIRHQEAPRC